MRFLYFTLAAFFCIWIPVRSQESYELHEKLTFDSEEEETLWQKGKSEPGLLFLAVNAKSTEFGPKWANLVNELDRIATKEKKPLKVLRQVFQRTQQNILRVYTEHATVSQMLSEGKFDCVSGSAALALLLERYGFDFEIIETDYHVFILVTLEGSRIVLESTLRVGGMITSSSGIKTYLSKYKSDGFSDSYITNHRIGDLKPNFFDNTIFRSVSLIQLAGLQYYNDAISLFNKQAYEDASKQLVKASELYPSERIVGLRSMAEDLAFRSIKR